MIHHSERLTRQCARIGSDNLRRLPWVQPPTKNVFHIFFPKLALCAHCACISVLHIFIRRKNLKNVELFCLDYSSNANLNGCSWLSDAAGGQMCARSLLRVFIAADSVCIHSPWKYHLLQWFLQVEISSLTNKMSTRGGILVLASTRDISLI